MQKLAPNTCRFGALSLALLLVLARAASGDHWAFQPVTKAEVPRPDVNPIDAFITAGLEGRNL